MSEATLTTKGRVTVPRDIREKLQLVTGDKLMFQRLSDGTLIMRVKTRMLPRSAGILK